MVVLVRYGARSNRTSRGGYTNILSMITLQLLVISSLAYGKPQTGTAVEVGRPENAFIFRGLVCEHSDTNYINKMLHLCETRYANISHLLIHCSDTGLTVEQLSIAGQDDEHVRNLRRICEMAHADGIKVELVTYESARPSQADSAINNLTGWKERNKHVRQAYEKVFRFVPELDGVVITLDVGQYVDVTAHSSAVKREDPIIDIIRIITEVGGNYKKDTIFRAASRTRQHTANLRESLQTVAANNKRLCGNMVFMARVEPTNTVCENETDYVAGLRWIMELDVSNELGTRSGLLCDYTDFIYRAMSLARRGGGIGVVANLGGLECTDTVNAINIYAYNRFLGAAPASVGQLRREWLGQRYKKETADYLASALARTTAINNCIFDAPSGTDYSQRSNYAQSDAAKSVNDACIKNWPAICQTDDSEPFDQVLARLSSIKELGRRLNDQAICDLLQTKPVLNAEDFNDLLRYFKYNELCLEVCDKRSLVSYLTSRYIRNQPECNDVNIPNMKLILRYRILANISKLYLDADRIEKGTAQYFVCLRPDDIREFCRRILEHTQLTNMYQGRRLRFNCDSIEASVSWQKATRRQLSELLLISDLEKLRPMPLNEKELSSQDMGSFTLREVEIDATPSRRTTILVGMPKAIRDSYPAVVCLVGHGSSKASSYDLSPQSVMRGFGHRLSSAGVITVSHGISHSVYEKDRLLMGERVWDAMRSIDYLYSLPEVDKTRIGCAGLSIGGEMAMWLAAMDQRCSACVSSGFLTFMDQMEQKHCKCWQVPGMRDLVDWPDLYCLIAPRYLQCQNGLAEPVSQFHVPVARATMEEIKPIYEVFGRPQNVELYIHDGGHVIDMPALIRFFENAWKISIVEADYR